MATDATGTPTPLGIPTFNTAVQKLQYRAVTGGTASFGSRHIQSSL